MPYILIDDTISNDTVEALEQCLELARSGLSLGLVYGIMFKRKRYLVGSTGEARRSPTFSRGMLAALDDHLRELVQAKSFEETR